jgi:hypothetical protein
MGDGEKCICQESEWFNAFGDAVQIINLGMRLTVKSSMYVGGTKFYLFEEIPDAWFLHTGFKPLRSLN